MKGEQWTGNSSFWVNLDFHAQPSQGFCRLDKARQAHHVEMKIANLSYTNISCFEMRTRLLFVIISVDTDENCKSNFSRSNRTARWYNIFTMVLEKHPSDLELHYESSTPTSQKLSSSSFQSYESGSVTFNQISTFLSDPGPIIVYACQ